MLSVLIETLNDEEGLARTLGSLIHAVVEGAVRDVVVCDRGSADQTHYVAEHAGCHFLATGGLVAGIAAARSDWLLVLEPGARLLDGWIDEARAHINRATLPARFSRARTDRPRFWTRMFGAGRPLEQGLLIAKRQAAALAKHAATGEALARGLAMKTLAAEISPAKR